MLRVHKAKSCISESFAFTHTYLFARCCQYTCDISHVLSWPSFSFSVCACVFRRPALCCSRTAFTTSRRNSFATLHQILKQPDTTAISTSLHRSVLQHPPPTPAPSWCTGSGWWLTAGPWPTRWIRVWRTSSWPWLGAAGPFCVAVQRLCRRVWWSSWSVTSSRSWRWP